MKKLTLTTIALAVAISAFSQGTIAINNRETGVLLAPVYGVIPGAEGEQRTGNTATGLPTGNQNYGSAAALTGSGFTFALFGGSSDGNLQLLGTTVFRTSATTAGFVVAGSPTVMVPGVPAGGSARLQVRAWDNKGGTITDWDAAFAASRTGGTSAGLSAIFSSAPLGGTSPSGSIFLTPAALYGMESFNLTIVPEPSTIALGILGGLGTLVLLRRRK
jgi:hypothetical protein